MWTFTLEKKTGWGRERANQKPACRDKLESWLKKVSRSGFQDPVGRIQRPPSDGANIASGQEGCLDVEQALRPPSPTTSPQCWSSFLSPGLLRHWLTSSGGITEVRGVGGGLFACLFSFKDFIYFHLFGVLWKLNLSLKYFLLLLFIIFSV